MAPDQASLFDADLVGKSWVAEGGAVVTVLRVAGVKPEGHVRCSLDRQDGTQTEISLPLQLVRTYLEGQPESDLVGFRFPTEDGEGVVTHLLPGGQYAAVSTPAGDTCRPVALLRRAKEFESGAAAAASQPKEGQMAAAQTTRRTRKPKEAPAAKAAAPKAKKPSQKATLAAMDKDSLREYLLTNITIPDSAWRENYGSPEREAKETRSEYILRVLGA
jgi:hypothetical protein